VSYASVVADLSRGDFIESMGGKAGGVNYKRYRVGFTVEDVWAEPGARTQMHLRLGNGTVFRLHCMYPVMVRPAAEIAAEAADLRQRVNTVKDDPAFQARIAERRRNR
jgi:hypothetical protein